MEHIATGELETAPFNDMIAASQQSKWTHCIARFDAKTSGHSAKVLQDLKKSFQCVDHPSIYTNQGNSSRARAEYLVHAIRDVEANGLTGAFVEVGVAAGHSSVIAALASSPHMRRDFYLYDTFAGFGEHLPDEKDHTGISIRKYDLSEYTQEECTAPSVRSRVAAAGQPERKIYTIEGYAQTTIPLIKPPRIAILRLDADLFDPTIVALRELYDLVEDAGCIVIDDYGHWEGCASAVNLFFEERARVVPGEKIDYTCYGWRK